MYLTQYPFSQFYALCYGISNFGLYFQEMQSVFGLFFVRKSGLYLVYTTDFLLNRPELSSLVIYQNETRALHEHTHRVEDKDFGKTLKSKFYRLLKRQNALGQNLLKDQAR